MIVPFLGQIGPKSGGKLLSMQAQVQAFFNRDALEIGLPELLVELLACGQFFLGKMRREGFREPDLFYLSLSIMVIAIGAAGIIDEPRLVGETVGEVMQGERIYIIYRCQGGEINAVGCLLEAGELDDAAAFAAHLLPYLRAFQHIGVGEVIDVLSFRVEEFAQVAEEQLVHAGKFGEPARRNSPQEFPFHESRRSVPYPLGESGVGRDLQHLVVE